MRAFFETVMNGGLKLALIAYLVVAFLVGVQKHRDGDTPQAGAVVTIIEGAAWPITLLIDAVQRQ
jgi:hypothetical protein